MSYEDQIEAFIDGALSSEEEAAFRRRLASDEALRQNVLHAEHVRSELRQLPSLQAPQSAVQPALAAARSAKDRRALPQQRRALERLWPAAVAAAALVLAVIGIDRLTPAPVSHAEVEAALHDVQWTLAYVSDMGRHGGKPVRIEVIEQQVAEPMNKALGYVIREDER